MAVAVGAGGAAAVDSGVAVAVNSGGAVADMAPGAVSAVAVTAGASGIAVAADRGGAAASSSRAGNHWLLQRAQRTIFPGVRRESGTSYVVSQLGQAMRMESCRERRGA
jgi:hypothetical protein